MNKPLKHLSFFLSFLVGLIVTSQGQVKSFSDNPVAFMEELKSFFEAGSADKSDAHSFLRKFETEYWSIGKTHESKFNESQKQMCYEVCNLMLKKRLRPPDFRSYLTSMMNFVDTKQSEKNFLAWQDCINKILNGKAIKSYTEYLAMSENLFAYNVFYKSPTYEWSSNTNNYEFQYDSVPKIVFNSLNLVCHNNQSDSVSIVNTKGVYFPSTGKFIGTGGTVNWLKAGLEQTSVYAELKKYEIIVKTGGYTADSVIFYNKTYFSKPLMGQLADKALAEAGGAMSYPRFESYSKRLQINDLAERVNYDGGFSMRGPKFIGSGTKEQEALLIFKRSDRRFLVVSSKQFFITKEKLASDNASIKIFFDADSIYHPGLSFKYLSKDKQVSLIRSDDGLARTAFLNSYHALDMYFEELTWKTDEPQILLKMLLGNTQGEADFESAGFFKVARYEQLQGMDGTNPLVMIKNYVKSINDLREFYVVDLARYMHATANDLRPLLVRLAVMGLLNYDAESDKLQVKDRLFQYITDRVGKSDYDVLTFHSVLPNEANGLINLLNYDLTIRGVSAILLSDSQNVVIYPLARQVVVKKNRDFTFAGRIHAGRFDFYGKQFAFNYDAFKIDIIDADSLRMAVQSREPNERGEFPLVKVKSVIEHINGDLLIDHPKNKSGYKSYTKYPIFNSAKDSYVYYQKKSVQSGVYSRDKFYFHLEPFTIDSVDNFSNEGVIFEGEFVSSGIFPQFKEPLKLQKDYSLGFRRPTPAEGFALYGGKARFNDTIMLSHEGLRGNGVINYVTSTSKSRDFIFFPDSMNGISQNFDVKESKQGKIEFPQVSSEGAYLHWMPYKDVMQAHSREKPFTTYNGQATFKGRYDLTPQLLTGRGLVSFQKAELEALNIKFKQNAFDSDTADFRLQSLEESALAFSTSNVNAHIDFTKRDGEFKSNGKGSIVKFPVNQYVCFMESFKWYMDRSDIELGTGDKPGANDLDLQGPEFISTNPKQDSLRFNAPRAKYDLKKYIITAMDVKYINVADARVSPDSGKVVIRKEAAMETLKNAKILANSVTKYHNIYGANVNIFTRKSYSGSGSYDYVDELKKKQPIYFSNITVDTTYQTYAETEIKDSTGFMLSPNFEYKGKVKLQATNQFLTFTGVTRIQHACDAVKKTWFRFSAEVDPNKILIPVEKDPVDDKGNKLGAGIMLSNDSTHIYSTFLSGKYGRSDSAVLRAEGFLFYDKGSKEYRISNKEKLIERNLGGNYVSLNIDKCITYGEGRVNMGTDFGQVKIETVGNAEHFQIPDSTSFDLMMTVDFFFDDGALDKMSDALNAIADLKPTDFSRKTYEKGLREMLGKEKADKLISQVNLYGSFKKFPDELKKTIFLTELKMRWNPRTRSYLSQGKIGVGNIQKNQVNKYVTGRVELVKKRGGDILNIYLEGDNSTWYYFNYTRGLMQALSSLDNFNTVIKELKPDKRELKTERGTAPYAFNLSTIRKKDDFLKRSAAGGAEE